MTAEILAGLQYLCLASKQQGLFKGLDEHLQKCWIWLSQLWLGAELEQGSTALGLPRGRWVACSPGILFLNFKDIVHSRGHQASGKLLSICLYQVHALV